MAEVAGKVGAFYAMSGTGAGVTVEDHTLVASGTWLAHKNVIVSNVYVGSTTGGAAYARWYCTPRGYLTVPDAGATDSVNANYRWWAEVGEVGTASGIIKSWGGFFNWSMDNTADVVERTDFDDGGHKSYLATLDGWAATAERHWVDSGLKRYLGSKLIVKFYVDDDSASKGTGSADDSGTRYEGYGIVIGLSPSTAVDTLINESVSFQGTGQLTYESG